MKDITSRAILKFSTTKFNAKNKIKSIIYQNIKNTSPLKLDGNENLRNPFQNG